MPAVRLALPAIAGSDANLMIFGGVMQFGVGGQGCAIDEARQASLLLRKAIIVRICSAIGYRLQFFSMSGKTQVLSNKGLSGP